MVHTCSYLFGLFITCFFCAKNEQFVLNLLNVPNVLNVANVPNMPIGPLPKPHVRIIGLLGLVFYR